MRLTLGLAVPIATVGAVSAQQPESVADYWAKLNRFDYLSGFMDGHYSVAVLAWCGDEEAEECKSLAESYAFFKQHQHEIVDIINQFYADPANAYLGPGQAAFLAMKKLKAKDMEEELRAAGREGLERKERLERISKDAEERQAE